MIGFGLSGGISTNVFAQTPETDAKPQASPATSDAASEAPLTEEQKVQRAKAFIKQARAARQSGNLEATIEFLLKAYDLNPRPVLLNNVGKVYEENGRYDPRTPPTNASLMIPTPRTNCAPSTKSAWPELRKTHCVYGLGPEYGDPSQV